MRVYDYENEPKKYLTPVKVKYYLFQLLNVYISTFRDFHAKKGRVKGRVVIELIQQAYLNKYQPLLAFFEELILRKYPLWLKLIYVPFSLEALSNLCQH